jgi:hypothetical protein
MVRIDLLVTDLISRLVGNGDVFIHFFLYFKYILRFDSVHTPDAVHGRKLGALFLTKISPASSLRLSGV